MKSPFVSRKRYEEVHKVVDDLYSLLVEHHATNRMEGFHAGQMCPVCVDGGHSHLTEILKRHADLK